MVATRLPWEFGIRAVISLGQPLSLLTRPGARTTLRALLASVSLPLLLVLEYVDPLLLLLRQDRGEVQPLLLGARHAARDVA